MYKESRETAAVLRRLHKTAPDRVWAEIWESFPLTSQDAFRESAVNWLKDRTDMRGRTIDSADWDYIYRHFLKVQGS